MLTKTHLHPLFSMFFSGSLLIALWLFSGPKLYAQVQDTINLSDLNFNLIPDSAGASEIHFAFHLGTVNEPVESVQAYEVEIELPNWSGTPTAVSINLAESGVGTEKEGQLFYSYDTVAAVLLVHFSLDSSFSADAEGLVFEALVTSAEELSQEEKFAQVGGGMVMVDNMELKWQPKVDSPTTAIAIGPNPFQQTLRFTGQGANTGRLFLTDLYGKVVYSSSGNIPSVLHLQGILPGCYWVTLQLDSGESFRRKVISTGR